MAEQVGSESLLWEFIELGVQYDKSPEENCRSR